MLGMYRAAHRTARLYGFRFVETPTFEHTELFVRTSGETSDVVTKEMYTFEDKGGRSITLRPENTAPIVRAYLSHAHDLPSPFKAYYVGPQFRHGRPQAGRLREFRQFGIEILGVEDAAADVEVIDLGERYVRDRGLRDYTVVLNSIGDAVCRPAYRQELIAYLEPYRAELDEDCRTRLEKNPLRVFDCKVDGRKDFVLAAPTIADHLCEPCAAHFAAVRSGLEDAGIAYELDPRLVRGLDYYTRTAFEWVSGSLEAAQSTVNAGGRYDGLAEELGGPPTPGVGFAMGLDRVLLALHAEDAPVPGPRTASCYVVAIGDGRDAARGLLRELRSAGVPAETTLGERPLGAQLRMADRAGAAYAAILGEREVAEGVVTMRRLADGEQEKVPQTDVVNWLSSRDGRGALGETDGA
jgi:histidyl-tRNA synthetase